MNFDHVWAEHYPVTLNNFHFRTIWLIKLTGAGTCTLALAVLGPGAPTDGGVGALPLADVLEDGVEEPASVGATESEVPRSGLVLLLFLLLLQPLLGHSVMKSDE